MCGFVGFSNFLEKSEIILGNMLEKIVHRGPDDENHYIDDKIALGFRRLSIIDINGGRQPMFNEDKTKILVFNGEIYNASELRVKLIKSGHIFANNSDSEVLLHGYEEYDSKILTKLRGMFSFVIYDKKNSILFGARDMFGIKPFYYYLNKTNFIFGSEIKSFLPHPSFTKQINLTALEHFLSFQYSVGDQTFFKNVFKLAPAHFFTYNLKTKKLKIKRYFSLNLEPDDSLTLDEWVKKIGIVFQNSIDAHKISDVEVSSLLSSGIDSSLIAASANVSKTFTVGFANNGYNEIDYAEKFSEHVKIKNYSKKITEKEFFNIFPKIQYHMDEPLADASAVALFFACQTAAKHVKVILSGEGADEIFGGYNIYKDPIDNKIFEKIPFFIRSFIAKAASLFKQKRGINYLIRHGTKLEDRFIGNANIFDYRSRNRLINFPAYAQSPSEFLKPLYNQVTDFDDMTKMQFIDLNTWLVGDILQKADKMSMANSIELRVPFLDKKVFELAKRIPTKFKVNKKNTKFALRQYAQNKLPKFIAQKKKLGFPVPIKVWLRQEKFYKKISESFHSVQSKYFFKIHELEKLLNNHITGKTDESRKIWTVFTFLVWHNQFFG